MNSAPRPVNARILMWPGMVALVLSSLVAAPSFSAAQGIESIESHYTKYEYRIPMRDGVRLFTSVYVPKDTSKTYPFLMTRTPYSVRPYGVDQYRDHLGPTAAYAESGYIFVYQDVRGRWMSEGEFVNMRPHRAVKQGPADIDESTDTWDTIDWLVRHVAGHNGKLGMMGISYPGFYTNAGMIDAHPALVACSPQAPITDWFIGDDWHHNGALLLPHAFNFMATFGRPRPEPTKRFTFDFEHGTNDGYAFFDRLGPLANADAKYFRGDVAFWNEVMRHPNYDEFWQSRNIRPHLKSIRPAVMTVGGWFDAENLFGALQTYRSIETQGPQSTNRLVMGPWNHGGWAHGEGDQLGDVSFRSKTSEFYREKIEFPFFEYHLKEVGDGKFPEAWVFETGTNRWRTFDAWPPQPVREVAYYLQAGGQLLTESPAIDDAAAADEFPSDPAKPVPFLDRIAIGMVPDYMTADQRHAARRPDVLVYQTAELTSDLTVMGPIDVDLFVATTGTDADWIVKVIDVYPDDHPDLRENPRQVRLGGYQQLVRGDVMRGKFRDSFEHPAPFVPGEPTRIRFTMPDICHSFRTGHRLMVQVQSTWFPLIDRNPQRFVDIYTAQISDFQRATHRVFRQASRPSRVILRRLDDPTSSANR